MQKNNFKYILAIETSCDETAASVIEVNFDHAWPKIKTLSSVVKSQIKLHSKMGGVVPETAARAHVKYIHPVVEKTIKDSQLTINNIDYIAVTAGPGLLPSLLVGVEFAKALSFATGKPLIPVNHMLGHLYSPFSQLLTTNYSLNAIFPMISLIVSGGHTMLVLVKNLKDYKVLGQTVDDAVGEAFDKTAKMLGLPYPGGPEVSKLAEKGNSKSIDFPRPMLNQKNYNFSFSGLKTAVLYYLKNLHPTSYTLKSKQDICASFQKACVDVLTTKTMRAVKEFSAKSVSLSGGVAANASLRDKLKTESQKLKVKFMAPPMNLCTDNAEMIAIASAIMLKNGFKPKSFKNIKASPNLEL